MPKLYSAAWFADNDSIGGKMGQLLKACVLCGFIVGVTAVTLRGYDLLQQQVTSLFNAEYNPANFSSASPDAFSTQMQDSVGQIQASYRQAVSQTH